MKIKHKVSFVLIVLTAICLCCHGTDRDIDKYILAAFLSAVAFLSVLFPDRKFDKDREFRRLFGSIPFWFAVTMAVYVFIQYVNVSVVECKIDGGYIFNEINYVHWLPSSVRLLDNSLEYYLFYALSVIFLLSASIFVFESRKAIIFFCFIVAASISFVAIFYIIFKIGTYNPFELFDDNNLHSTSGVFSYHPIGNSIFLCGMAYISVLLVNLPSLKHKKLVSVFSLISICAIYIAILSSGGFAGILISTLAIVVLAAHLFLHIYTKTIMYILPVFAIFVVLLCGGIAVINPNMKSVTRVSEKISGDSGLSVRLAILKMNFEIAKSGGEYSVYTKKKSPNLFFILYGRGSNSYEILSKPYFIFDKDFQKNFVDGSVYKIAGISHSNFMQFIIELGLVGSLVITIWI